MNTFIPEIYRRMGTHVAVDLGAATKIGEIDANVDTLKTQLTHVPGHIDATVDSVKTALSTSSQKTDAAVASLQSLLQAEQEAAGARHEELLSSTQKTDSAVAGLLATVQAEQQAAATRQQALLARLDQLESAIPTSADGDDDEDKEEDEDDEDVPDITPESAPRVAALVALQGVVLTGTSSATEYQNAFNKADAVLKKFVLPVEVETDWLALVIPPSGWSARSERYWALADLIDVLAAPLPSGGGGSPVAQAAS